MQPCPLPPSSSIRVRAQARAQERSAVPDLRPVDLMALHR